MPSQRRNYFRLDVAVPVDVQDSGGKRYTFQTHDLSGGGMKVTADGVFPIGSYLRIRLKLDGAKETVDAVGMVKWIHPAAAGTNKWSMGIEFVQIDEPSREKIQKFVNAKVLEMRRRGLI